jgi:purine-binding chemotaxis protein CheW
MNPSQNGAGKALARIDDVAGTFELMVLFRLAGQEFGLMASQVREIINIRHATRIPNSQGVIEGVINLRGRILPVFNLRKRLGFPTPGQSGGARTVMVVDPQTLPGGVADAGLLVDEVADVLRVSEENIDRNASTIAGSDIVDGTVKLGSRLVTLLDLNGLLAT